MEIFLVLIPLIIIGLGIKQMMALFCRSIRKNYSRCRRSSSRNWNSYSSYLPSNYGYDSNSYYSSESNSFGASDFGGSDCGGGDA